MISLSEVSAVAGPIDPKVVKYVGKDAGSLNARRHYPYAVIEDKQELRQYAFKAFAEWLGDSQFSDPDEVKRLWIASFIGNYEQQIADLRAREEEEKESAAKKQREAQRRQEEYRFSQMGVTPRVVKKRNIEGAVLYEIEFIDPARMTRSVSFGLRVGDDGEVEVQEL